MLKFDLSISHRSWSWFFGVISFALPVALYAYQHWQFGKWAARQSGFVCGMPLLAALILSALIAFVLSLSALYFGLRGYYKLDKPRHWKRLIEALLLGSASILLTVVLGLAWLFGRA